MNPDNEHKETHSRKTNVVCKNGPIVIIEDDTDDQEIMMEVFQKLNYPNKVLFFSDGQEAHKHA